VVKLCFTTDLMSAYSFTNPRTSKDYRRVLNSIRIELHETGKASGIA